MCTCARSYYVRRRRVLWFQEPNHAEIFYVLTYMELLEHLLTRNRYYAVNSLYD